MLKLNREMGVIDTEDNWELGVSWAVHRTLNKRGVVYSNHMDRRGQGEGVSERWSVFKSG